jgi:hypothetical protein
MQRFIHYMFPALGLVSIFVLTGLQTAIAIEPASAKLVESFYESVQPEVNVSGNVIAGVMGTSALTGDSVRNILVYPALEGGIRDICLRVVSRDGIYTSRNVYRLPDSIAGEPVRLPYDKSSQLELLGSYADKDIAMTAVLGSCDTADSLYYVISASNSEQAENIRLYINSFGATDVYYQVLLGDSEWSDAEVCTYVSEGRRTTFDFWCDVPGALATGNRTELRIQRERFGRAQPAVDIRVIGVLQGNL